MKDILVSLNNEEAFDNCLWAAAQLADVSGATINGLYVKPLISYKVFGLHFHPELYDEFEASQNLLTERTKTRFLAYASSINSDARFIEGAGDSSREILIQSAVNDLVIVGSHKQWKEDSRDADLPAEICLACGRPVIIVPELSNVATMGRSVLLAWNGSRESTRALHDAMPILQSSDYVNVVTFTPEGDREDVVDIGLHLDHYGVTYDITHSICSDADIPGKILNFVAQFDSDLLVMGAYGHSRLRELVLGGVSRSLFSQTKIPLLVSH